MSDPNPSNAESFQLLYERARPNYARLTSKLQVLLQELLHARGISVHLIESRTKEVASFREKITRSSKAYGNPLIELTDLSGVRIITYYQDDADAVGTLLKSEFEIQSSDTGPTSAAPHEFGYRSAHYVVRLSDRRASLVEWGGLGGLSAEVQVRTVLQHAWAAISHKLQYKREDDVPQSLRRKLSRLSALFEIADDEFLSLKGASGALLQEISVKLSIGDRQIAIDKLSVKTYLERSRKLKRYCEIAEAVGFRFSLDPDEEAVHTEFDSVSEIIQLCGVMGLRTVEDLDQAITTDDSAAERYLSKQYHADGEQDPGKWGATPGFICQLMLLKAKAEHVRIGVLTDLDWDVSIATRVLEVARAFEN